MSSKDTNRISGFLRLLFQFCLYLYGFLRTIFMVQKQQGGSDHNVDEGRKGYFVVGEIVLQAQHNPRGGNAPTQAELKAWVQSLWEKNELGALPTITDHDKDKNIPSFRNSEYTSSFIHLRLNLPVEAVKDDAERDRQLIAILNKLNDPQSPKVIDGITLRSAVPNWCLTGCGHSPTEPGPGAYPQPVADSVIISNPNKHGFSAAKLDNLTNHNKFVQPVNVVIFDTAPHPDALSNAYEALQKNGAFQNNDLLKEMKKRKDAGQFTIKYAADPKLGITLPTDLAPDHSEGYTHHDLYDMSDHGLFIAGIIADHLPPANVNIYLVQTQNDHGVGTIKTLADGITALIEEKIIPKDQMDFPLIVNCSLCVSFRMLEELRCLGLNVSVEGDLDTINPANIEDVKEFHSLLDPLQTLETRFRSKEGEIRIIAAAGNDSIPPDESADPENYKPYPPRYPAAFDFVLGVGAFEKGGKGGKRAFYSNLADVPANEGLMVFGGKAQRRQDKANDADNTGEGMLGLYVGNFPDGTPSTNGWAWWAGTSFATAAMSGIFARAAAKGKNINHGAASDFHDDLKGNKKGDTNHHEPFIDDDQN